MNVIFTCGGTAGHVNPALALAGYMQERHPDPVSYTHLDVYKRQVLVMGYIQLTAVTGSISDLQEQVSQLEDQRVSLVMDYERTFDMAKIKEAAEAAGMKKPTAGQVEYVELGGGSKAEVYQAESDSLLSRLTHSVKNGVGALVEYFR